MIKKENEYKMIEKILDIIMNGKTITKLFLDYDGTLVPLVSSPELAKADDYLITLLDRLKKIFPLYIITGRDLNDLLGLLGGGYNVIAMHGAEFVDENGSIKNIENFDYYVKKSSMIAQKYSFLSEKFPGVRVYDKRGGVQFHYFNIRRDLIESFQEYMKKLNEEDFELYSGKYVFEFRIKGVNKGKAILERIDKDDYILFAGDDNTDEEAFALLNDHITIKVGDGVTKAKYRLTSYIEFRELLKFIADKYGGK